MASAVTVKEIRRQISSILATTQGMPPMDQSTMNAKYYEAAAKAAELVDTPNLKTEILMDVVAGQKDYLAPADLMEFVDVQYLNTVTGCYETMKNVELSTLRQDRGNQIVYAHAGVYRTPGVDFGRKIIRFSLAPEANITNGLLISYRSKPLKLESLADTDEVVDFPDSIQAIIPWQAAFLWMGLQGSKVAKD